MNANERESIEMLVEDVVETAYEVANTLGCGFPEKMYERALAKELVLRGRAVARQASYSVMYKRALVGEYLADLIVEEKLVVELKCVEQFAPEHMAQCINYLRVSGLQIALLINFQGRRSNGSASF